MNTIFAKLLYELEKKHDTMLVTIISDQGSTPRGAGSQMLVGEKGRMAGTIGGGAVERRSEELAMELLKGKTSGTHEFRLHRNAKEDIGMVCGGDVRVCFQYISGTDAIWQELAVKLTEQVKERKPGWLILKLDGGSPVLLDEKGRELAGQPVSGTEADPSGLTGSGNVLTETCFSMPLPVGERAVLFGGGHCSYALVPILKSVGFRVTVFDCREEFAKVDRFPDADAVICGDYLKIADSITLNKDDYVVVMTNGHSHDYEVQEQALRGPLAYIGVIGSRAKAASVNARLRLAGVPEEAIQRVYTPIGTAIKAVTPEEIAVSIAGEMIYVRALRREEGKEVHHGCPMH